MQPFHLDIFEADGTFFSGDAVSVILPLTDGSYGVQAHHRNMIAALIPGKLTFTDVQGNRQIAAVANGMLKIENGRVLVLTESAERPEEIDERKAQADADRAKEQLLQQHSLHEYHAAQSALARAINRLNVRHQTEIN